ncbi:DUF1963 domain-containing protein [Streptomyces sp. NPDC086033]|uniref:DUF1963 domain-containing protein n=1 Tax=unclassified Streptomyces TaxID=2593676 RepID=UPI000851EFF7|nr:DUF1963 domain-containing protein [Streptomyces sp. LUP47B]
MGHQVGGHAVPIQGPVEYGVTSGACGSMHAWGGVGALYWLVRPEELAAHRFGQVRLTMQCR